MLSGLLLAAGTSSRFGSPKPLALFKGQPVLTFLLKNLLRTKLDEIVVVLGAEAGLIRPSIIEDQRIRSVINERYLSGRTSSFKKGLSALSASSEGLLLLPVDTPFVQPQTIDLLIETYDKNPYPVLVPAYQGRLGHPPVFAKTLFPEFACLGDDEPLFTVQRRHSPEVLKLPVADEGVVLSFNTLQEFETIKNKFGSRD
ncbi:MAG: nucleotidyltransferase family protein [Candidatus Omnitrophota bacterium]